VTRRNGLRLAAGLLALLNTVAVISPAAAVSQGGIGGGGTVISVCKQLAHVTVKGRHGVVSVVRNDNFGGLPECLAIRDAGPNFMVSRQAVASPIGQS
jgi:hypothetical protein